MQFCLHDLSTGTHDFSKFQTINESLLISRQAKAETESGQEQIICLIADCEVSFYPSYFADLREVFVNKDVAVVYSDFEYQCAMKLAIDPDFANEYCVEIIRKKLDEGFPENRQVVKVDFNSCENNMLVGVCWGTTIPTKKELMMMSRNALAIANDPKVLGYTKVLY